MTGYGPQEVMRIPNMSYYLFHVPKLPCIPACIMEEKQWRLIGIACFYVARQLKCHSSSSSFMLSNFLDNLYYRKYLSCLVIIITWTFINNYKRMIFFLDIKGTQADTNTVLRISVMCSASRKASWGEKWVGLALLRSYKKGLVFAPAMVT